MLTGSNMSGKSTFLRTIGVNLVLARAGSVVCAKTFLLFPFDLYVSIAHIRFSAGQRIVFLCGAEEIERDHSASGGEAPDFRHVG